MTLDTLLALAAFAAICSFTPGPNNTLLMASGLQFGFRQTFPMALGVILGFPLMIVAVGLGLGEIFVALPQVYVVLKYAGATYLLYLAWKIATAPLGGGNADSSTRPMTFLNMVLFQWINPKGWIIALTALSTYTIVAHYYLGVMLVAGMFLLTGIGSSMVWSLFGAALQNVINNPRWFRTINIGLALALIASLWPMLAY